MALPNVLLIGSMKSGTTGLYMDLTTHPDVFLAQEKEPQCLCSDNVLTDEGRRQYAARYELARKGQVICDASTDYSKRPDFDGVFERAIRVLPQGFKVIYMVRHPIDRIFSQHHHEYSAGLVSQAVNHEVRRHSRYLDYSSYAYQLEPWLRAIGHERIMVVRFEDYKSRRGEVVEEVCMFLGLKPKACRIRMDVIYNDSAHKPVTNQFWSRIAGNPFYRNVLRKLISPRLRLAIYPWLLPSAPQKPSAPTEEVLNWLRESLNGEVLKLTEQLSLDEPLWSDFAGVATNNAPTTTGLPVSLPSGVNADANVSFTAGR